MVLINKRTIWGIIYCQNQLVEFRNNLVDYFNNCQLGDWSNEIHENDRATTLRSNLNQNLLNIQEIIHGADVETYLIYTPPAMVGGYRQNIDVISNIFHLHQYKIKPKHVLDFIDRAIGVYKNDERKSLIRTFNPFFWIVVLLDFIVSAPFKLLGKVGVNAKLIEQSNVGKIAKFILYIVSLLAGVISIAQPLGWLEHLKKFISG